MSTKYLKRVSNPERNAALKVAQFANPKRNESKGQKRLARRMADYALMMGTKNGHGGAQQRKDTGGFHRPGSNQ